MLLGPGLQVEHAGPEEPGAVGGGGPHHLLQVTRVVGNTGDDRGQRHPGVDAPSDQSLHGLKALAGRGGSRLQLPDKLTVHGGDAEADRAPRPAGKLLQHVHVPDDHGPLGDQAHGAAPGGKRLQAAARQPVLPLDGLIGVRGGADDDLLPPPRWAGKLLSQHLGHVGLYEDNAGKVVPGVQLIVGVEPACKAVVAAVDAPSVGIEGPAEVHPADPVDGGPAEHLLVADSSGHRRSPPQPESSEDKTEHVFLSRGGWKGNLTPDFSPGKKHAPGTKNTWFGGNPDWGGRVQDDKCRWRVSLRGSPRLSTFSRVPA